MTFNGIHYACTNNEIAWTETIKGLQKIGYSEKVLWDGSGSAISSFCLSTYYSNADGDFKKIFR